MEKQHTSGIDDLRRLNRNLSQLLDDPELEPFTWHIMLGDTLKAIADYAGLGNLSAFPELLAASEAFLSIWRRAGPQGSHQFEKFDHAVRLAEIAVAKATTD